MTRNAPKDPLAIVEAAYSFDVPEAEWVKGIVKAARPFTMGDGAMAYIAEMSAAIPGSHLRRAPAANDHAVEAVLSPSGKLLDARAAEARALTGTLTDAVKRSERARSRKANPEERLATWTALVEGRWSIVETTESDGKRMLLAVKNEPRTATLRKLDTREQAVVAYAALGHSFKYIAYELGITPSTVSTTVTRALRKLGLESRADLIRVFG